MLFPERKPSAAVIPLNGPRRGQGKTFLAQCVQGISFWIKKKEKVKLGSDSLTLSLSGTEVKILSELVDFFEPKGENLQEKWNRVISHSLDVMQTALERRQPSGNVFLFKTKTDTWDSLYIDQPPGLSESLKDWVTPRFFKQTLKIKSRVLVRVRKLATQFSDVPGFTHQDEQETKEYILKNALRLCVAVTRESPRSGIYIGSILGGQLTCVFSKPKSNPKIQEVRGNVLVVGFRGKQP